VCIISYLCVLFHSSWLLLTFWYINHTKIKGKECILVTRQLNHIFIWVYLLWFINSVIDNLSFTFYLSQIWCFGNSYNFTYFLIIFLSFQQQLNLDPGPVAVNCCSYNHNGQLLLAGAADGRIRLFGLYWLKFFLILINIFFSEFNSLPKSLNLPIYNSNPV
jgi:hypothetical protein